MNNRISIESLENAKDIARNAVSKARATGLYYADVRVEIDEGKGASALNGNVKGAAEDYGISVGARSYAKNNGTIAAGHAGKSIGVKEFGELKKTLKGLLELSYKRAKISAGKKAGLKKKSGFFGSMITAAELAYEPVHVDTWAAPFR